MILENHLTKRLRFRSLEYRDKDPLVEFFSNPEATEFLFIREEPDTCIDSWIERQIERYQKFDLGLCGIELRSTSELIGQCGLLWQEIDGRPELEIGYHFIPRFWGKGYASEAAKACKDFAFEHELAPHLISIIHPDNFKSQEVARRNNMTLWKKSTFNNFSVIVFRIDRNEWGQAIPPEPPKGYSLS